MDKQLQSLKDNPLLVKYRNFLIPVISFLVCLVLIIFIIIPQIQDYLNSRTEEQSLKERILQLTQKKQILDSIDVGLYKANLEVALSILPSDKDIPGAVGDLLILLSANRLKLVNVSLDGDKVLYNSKALVVKIDTSGDPQAINNFLTSTGDSIRLMRVGRIETSSGTSNAISASFDIAAFYEPIPTVSSALDAKVNLPTDQDLELIKKVQAELGIGNNSESTASSPLGKDNLFQ